MRARRSALRRALVVASGLALLAACSSTSTKPKPTPVPEIKPQIAGKQVWSYRLDSVQFPLSVAAQPGGFTLAGSDGRVVSLAAANGAEQWRADVGAKIAAGVGSDGRYAAVVTRDNELVTLDAGRLLWRSQLASRVTTAPLVAGERVFVMGVDRVVQAFDALDGRKLWSLQRPGDALTLSQASIVAPYKDTLVVAQGARLTGVDPLKGSVRWEVQVASPRGTNEVERLADLVGPMARSGDNLCARAFQSAVGCVSADRGTLLWSKNNAGKLGLAVGDDLLYGADASDRISAWRVANGDLAWSSEKFLYRGLSAPATIGKTLVFGDVEGQVLFLSGQSGDLLLRLPTDGSPVVAAPSLSGTTLLVVTRSGGVFAFRPE